MIYSRNGSSHQLSSQNSILNGNKTKSSTQLNTNNFSPTNDNKNSEKNSSIRNISFQNGSIDEMINTSLRKNQNYILCPKCLTSGAKHVFIPYHEEKNGWIIGDKGYTIKCKHFESNSPTLLKNNKNSKSNSRLDKKLSVESLDNENEESNNMNSQNLESIEFNESCSHYESKRIIRGLSPNSTQSRMNKEVSQIFNQDIEDLIDKFQHREFSTPLIVDLALVDTHGNVKSVEELESNFDTIVNKTYGNDIVLRMHGKLATNIVDVNDRVHELLKIQKRKKVEGYINMLDLSSDRLCGLVKLENSILFNPIVHPSVHIVADRGEEQEACKELLMILDSIQHISNIHLIVNIIITKPFPDLVPILALLRSHKGLCKFILFELERDPSQIMRQFQNFEKDSSINLAAGNNIPESLSHLDMNPREFLEYISQCSAGSIHADDFFSASYGAMLEPFLRWMKIGDFRIQPSSLCGYCTILINSENYTSVPISQIMDMSYLFQEFVKILPRLKKVKSFPGFLLMRKMKKILSTSGSRKGTKLPNIFSYLITIDPKKKAEMEKVMNEIQFIVIHNKMDVGCIDVKRRALCSMCELDSNGENIIAQCTQII